MINLFDLIKIIFNNPNKYNEISKLDKKKNFFMINRRFAINYPLQSQVFNRLGINESIAIDIWQNFLFHKYNGKSPGWLYIKGIKTTNSDKEKKSKISKDTIKNYAKFYNLEIKVVQNTLDIFGNDFIKELKQFEKHYKKIKE